MRFGSILAGLAWVGNRSGAHVQGPSAAEIRRPKPEIRKKSEVRNSKKALVRISAFFRISGFGLRTSTAISPTHFALSTFNASLLNYVCANRRLHPKCITGLFAGFDSDRLSGGRGSWHRYSNRRQW